MVRATGLTGAGGGVWGDASSGMEGVEGVWRRWGGVCEGGGGVVRVGGE
jgi:hypothetical protein